MKRGMVERPSSQRQPRVGITRIAKRTSNTVPSAQNICKDKFFDDINPCEPIGACECCAALCGRSMSEVIVPQSTGCT